MKKTTRALTISYALNQSPSGIKEVPFIRLKGKWLDQLGFIQGKKIQVDLSLKKIIITLIE